MLSSNIIGTGSYIPSKIQTNEDFHKHQFYGADELLNEADSQIITDKFEQITGIQERRYANDDQSTSSIAAIAAERAIADAGIDPETIGHIIFAHNFGDVLSDNIQMDAIPSLASRVKQILKIKNPQCIAYDLIFGCPGWVQGMIQADAFHKAGLSKIALVIGAETLSRVIDTHDRDSMIFADGAGATIIKYEESDSGMLSSACATHTVEESHYIYFGKSNRPEADPTVRYIKMHGRKVYEYALTHVPGAMKDCLEKANVDIADLKKIFIHQANEKLDMAVLKRFYRLYGIREVPEHIMPMSVQKLGNSSVATVPTLYDQVLKGNHDNHELSKGDVIMFASVGAGMNVNAITYRV